MPNARIGAMPSQPSERLSAKERKSRRVSKKSDSGRKGITIEDLKQQTALRLAKQQESRQRKNVRNQQQRHHLASAAHDHCCTHTPNDGHVDSFSNVSQFNNSHVTIPDLHHTYHPSHKSSQQSVQQQSQNQRFPCFESEPETPGKNVLKPHLRYQLHNSHAAMGSPQQPDYNLSNSHRPSSQAFNLNDEKTRNCSRHVGDGKSPTKGTKLPHGLTVLELKEMTRARLAHDTTDGDECMSASTSMSPVDGKSLGSDRQLNRQRVYSHEAQRNEAAIRQRLGSEDSFRSAPPAYSTSLPGSASKYQQHRYPDQKFAQNLSKSRSADSASVASYGSGFGSQSHFGSDASTRYTTNSSSRDVGMPLSFPAGSGSNLGLEGDTDQLGSFMTSSSFDTGTRRMTNSTALSSPGLSNLLEDKPFSPAIGASYSEEEGFDFSSFPTTPVIHKDGFADDVLSGILRQQLTTTPSTTIDYSLVDTPKFDRQTSRGGEVPNAVAESVLGSLEAESDTFQDYNKLPQTRIRDQNPWKEKDDDALLALGTDWKEMLTLESNKSVDDFPFSSFQSKATTYKPDWKSVEGQPLTPSNLSNAAVSENFCDDGVECSPASPAEFYNEAVFDTPTAQVVNKKKTTSKWKFR